MTELSRLLRDFHNSNTWIELAVLIACIAIAWGLVRLAGRGQPEDSIWFGKKTVDGVLFPFLALLLVYLASHQVARFQPIVVLKVAVPILVSLAFIRLFARVIESVFPRSPLMHLVIRAVSLVAWLAAVAWIVGVLPTIRDELDAITLSFGKTRVSIATMISGVLSAGLVLVVTLWISATIERRVLDQAVTDLSMRKVVSNVVRSVLILVGLLFALSAVGVDLTALSVLGGAVGVGLGFGLQKLASNYVSGFVILLERSIRIGDNVRVDSFEGRITDIKTRYTLIRAGNGRESIVPNELLITQRVENLSIADLKFNITTNIVVGYESNPEQVQEILTNAAKVQERVLKDPVPIAYLVNFAPDGIEFSLNFWVADPSKGQANIKSDINIAILKALREANIDIPYPQRSIRLDESLGKVVDSALHKIAGSP